MPSSSSCRKISSTFSSLFFAVLISFACLTFPSGTLAQSELAGVYGRVTDPSGAVIVDADVEIKSTETNVSTTVKTNQDGLYTIPSLHPGHYLINVRKPGFKSVTVTQLELNIQDNVVRNFALQVGSIAETVTITADSLNMNTTDGSVSTVVDRTYVENMPLNGRSFQSLILLTPGVVTTSPQTGDAGQFSVNGQRTESNYFTVDGVGANINPGGGLGVGSTPGISGSLAANTALGTTQSLVSVDALQEFRVQTSTYSAEYGRNPGGQFSFLTRSGANDWHGSAFDFLRNNVFDANDWFNDRAGFKQSALRQNDFGGTLGGPISIPRIYNGKDRTFFFFSYEGLRLLLPQPVMPTYVPTLALRQQVPAALQPVLNAFPLANGPDQGNGLAEFLATYSNPNQIDSVSLRVDQNFGSKIRVFFRFSDTPSFAGNRDVSSGNLADTLYTSSETQTYTVGMNTAFSSRINNEFRINYSHSNVSENEKGDNFGGAKPTILGQLAGFGSTYPYNDVQVGLSFFPNSTSLTNFKALNSQKQWNVTNTLSRVAGRQQFKVGVDYRRLTPSLRPFAPAESILYFNSSSAMANSADFTFVQNSLSAYPLYTNLSVFAQDEWRWTPRLSLSLGLRWELNPPPGSTNSVLPFTIQGSNNLSTMTLAPQGTPLWKTTYDNFAPRVGMAYLFRNSPGHESVLRGGVGVFFDTGNEYGSVGYSTLGFSTSQLYCSFSFCNGPNASFPLTATQFGFPVQTPPVAPYTNGALYAFDPHLALPYTVQWNASIEQTLGKDQALTVTYVGANGRRLLEGHELIATPFNPNFGPIVLYKNGLTSDYDALQIQFQRRLSHGLQAMGGYTWSHSLDYGSQNAALPYVRGNSDYDVRHNFAGAFSWNLPKASWGHLADAILDQWGLDGRFNARTGFPVTLNGNQNVDPVTGSLFASGLNLVPGQAIYLYGSQYPGGRAINSAAFTPPTGTQAGDAPRNFVRGFGAWQMDSAVRREFPIHERFHLQFRAEAFNIFNHPNFGLIDPQFRSPTFGQATRSLNRSLGTLSPLYQLGGPRSLQFALKLIF